MTFEYPSSLSGLTPPLHRKKCGRYFDEVYLKRSICVQSHNTGCPLPQRSTSWHEAYFSHTPIYPSCLIRPSSYAQRVKSLQFPVHRELIKQAISFMIALNGPEKNGEWEGGKWVDRMSGVVAFGRWTAEKRKRKRKRKRERGREREVGWREGEEREDVSVTIKPDGDQTSSKKNDFYRFHWTYSALQVHKFNVKHKCNNSAWLF